MSMFLKKPFYLSWVGLIFPFVITGSIFMKSTFVLRANGYEVSAFIDVIYNFEIIFASIMVFYVFGHYCRFLLKDNYSKN